MISAKAICREGWMGGGKVYKPGVGVWWGGVGVVGE